MAVKHKKKSGGNRPKHRKLPPLKSLNHEFKFGRMQQTINNFRDQTGNAAFAQAKKKATEKMIDQAMLGRKDWRSGLLGDSFIGNKGGSGRGSLLHRVTPTADNFGLGLRLNKGATVAGIGALAVGTALSLAIGQADSKAKGIRGRAEEVGSLPGMSYDAIGSGSRDLGATGDLVFGLNKMRRG